MGSRGSDHRQSSPSNLANRISLMMLSMFATMASFYIAYRLWQDAENRVYLIDELGKKTGHGKSSLVETFTITNCREHQERLAAINLDIEQAIREDFVANHLSENDGAKKQKLLAVIGIITVFGRKTNRDAVRKAWMPSGAELKKVQEEKGIVIRFVKGRSTAHGDSSDQEIDSENEATVTTVLHFRSYGIDQMSANDLLQENHVEVPQNRAEKTKLFFIHAVEHWDAEFYLKIKDDVYINIGEGMTAHILFFPDPALGRDLLDALGAVLASHLDKPRAYIGCMKSGEVLSLPKNRWYEPDWWKFGDGKSYFQHASGEVLAISHALAQFISINRLVLRTYAHDDVSIGSWFIGLDVNYVDESKLCCSSSWSSGTVCASAG